MDVYNDLDGLRCREMTLRFAKRHTYMTQRQRNRPTVFYSIADKPAYGSYSDYIFVFRHGGGSGVTWRVTLGMFTRGALSRARACGRPSDTLRNTRERTYDSLIFA